MIHLLVAFLLLASTASASVLTDEIKKLEDKINAVQPVPGPIGPIGPAGPPGPMGPPGGTTVPPPPPPPPVAFAVTLTVPGGTTVPLGGSAPLVITFSATTTSLTLSRGTRLTFAEWPTGNLTQYFVRTPTGVTFDMGLESGGTGGITAGSLPVKVTITNAAGQTASASVTLTVTGSGSQPPPPPTSSCPADSFFVSVSGNDNNPGTQAAPWRTMNKAAVMVTAGKTVCIANGTYEEAEVYFMKHGTATEPITIKAQNKGMALMNSVSGCNPALSLYGSHYVVDGLRISVSPNNPTCGIYTSANVAIRCWGQPGCTMRNLSIENTLTQRNLGIKSNSDLTIMEDSVIHGGFETFGSNGAHVRRNIIYDDIFNRYGGSSAGIILKGGARNNLVYDNVIHVTQPGGQGIIIGGVSNATVLGDGVECFNCIAYNNVVLNETGNPGRELLVFWSTKDSGFYNNIAIGGQLVSWRYAVDTVNSTVKNNIIICNGAATSGAWSGTLTADYNNFVNCTSGVPQQAHPITGDPKFVNPASDWHLQAGSPALRSGTVIVAPAYGGGTLDVSKNKDGAVRTAPWSLGIY